MLDLILITLKIIPCAFIWNVTVDGNSTKKTPSEINIDPSWLPFFISIWTMHTSYKTILVKFSVFKIMSLNVSQQVWEPCICILSVFQLQKKSPSLCQFLTWLYDIYELLIHQFDPCFHPHKWLHFSHTLATLVYHA